MAIRNFKFRIYPSYKQIRKLSQQIQINTELYNHLLNQAIEEYQNNKITLRRPEFSREVTKLRKEGPKYCIPYADTLRKTADQLWWAFDYFLERTKERLVKTFVQATRVSKSH